MDSPPSVPDRSYTLVSTLKTFWTFWEAAEGKDLDKQVEQFQSMVARAHPEIYQEKVIGRSGGTEPFSLDKRLREWLPDLPGRIGTMRKLTEEIAFNLRNFDRTFRQAFPSFSWQGKVYFTVSVDAFDGAVRRVNGEMALLFGIDKIAKLHGSGASLEPLFHHELFHMHHGHVNPSPMDDRTLLYPLWNEGLAVFVAKKLNPDATWGQLVLSDDMVRQGTQQLPSLAKELRPHLKGSTEASYRDFFLGAGKRQDIPNRVGYFVGFRVVQEVAKERSLAQLVRLRGKALFDAVDGVLARFAGVPQGVAR
ncbi:MAG: hypothetical protein H6707_18055 [Deltaproteobacteria bacterium]|nr:hypothetical protein [Deltaproteobacteria bacterium]